MKGNDTEHKSEANSEQPLTGIELWTPHLGWGKFYFIL